MSAIGPTTVPNTNAYQNGTIVNTGNEIFSISSSGPLMTFQYGNSCTFSVSPASQAFAAAGGSGTIDITGSAGCPWTATANSSWITITSADSGVGSATLSYSVAQNTTTSARTAIAIAGQTFTVTQAAAAVVCSYAVSPTSASFVRPGGNGTVSVTTGSGCAWTASSNASWITITSGSSRSGNGTVSYAVAAKKSKGSRSGTLTVAGRTVTIKQK